MLSNGKQDMALNYSIFLHERFTLGLCPIKLYLILDYNAVSRHIQSNHIDIPTSETSVFDLIITNIPDNINSIEVIDQNTLNLFSDHKCVLFDFQHTLTASNKRKRSVYDYKRANFEEMNGSLMNVDFAFTSPNSSSDINDDWTL